MSNCILCNIIAGKIPSKKIYEDEVSVAVLDVNGANPGHCFVLPKKHYTIFEQVPDNEVAKLFQASNKISTAIFEGLGVQGTNIFASNGIAAGQTVAHFMINVIPRKEKDGINLTWNPKPLSEEEMSTVEIKLKDALKNTGNFDRQETKKVHSAPKTIELSSDEEDYFEKQMKRNP